MDLSQWYVYPIVLVARFQNVGSVALVVAVARDGITESFVHLGRKRAIQTLIGTKYGASISGSRIESFSSHPQCVPFTTRIWSTGSHSCPARIPNNNATEFSIEPLAS
jgi:hypothetical protein